MLDRTHPILGLQSSLSLILLAASRKSFLTNNCETRVLAQSIKVVLLSSDFKEVSSAEFPQL